MKLLILVILSSVVYCSENSNKDGFERMDRRIAGGGNYGGFIGLTTYGAGPFLVNGKYESETDGASKEFPKDDSTMNDKYRSENIRLIKDENKDVNNFEYLGYRGPHGYCIDEFKNKDGYNNERNRNYSDAFNDELRNRCDKLFGVNGPTGDDEPDNLIRPCALDDWQCIRKYFAANSNCKPAYGPIPDPLYIDINTLFFPVVNATAVLPNLMIRGLSTGRITEFYVNKKSGNLVMALYVPDLNQTVPRAYFRFRRTAKESIVLADYVTIRFRGVTFTAVIPNIPRLRLDLADIHADSHDGTPDLFIGPGITSPSADPDVVDAVAQIFTMLPFAVREGFLFQSQLLTSIYIQDNICDFGLKLISV